SFLIRIAANNETICDPKCSIWDGLNPQNLVKPNENKFEIDSFSQRLVGLRNETKAQAPADFDNRLPEERGLVGMHRDSMKMAASILRAEENNSHHNQNPQAHANGQAHKGGLNKRPSSVYIKR
ncbi:MAG: hypothetical protein SFT68_02955, partial [Rickettsiaceae bacterium]|nr:hypothetical protein [Rickettsiaceae bacterium]